MWHSKNKLLTLLGNVRLGSISLPWTNTPAFFLGENDKKYHNIYYMFQAKIFKAILVLLL